MNATATVSPTEQRMPLLIPFLDGALFLLLTMYGLGILDPLELWGWGIKHIDDFKLALTLLGLLGMGWRYSQFGSRAWRRFQRWQDSRKALPPKDE